MKLEEKLLADYKQAMKSQDKTTIETLRLVRAAVKYASLEAPDAGETFSDSDVLAVLNREVKRRKESQKLFLEGGRDELAEKEAQEIAVISAYLPEELSESELESIVCSVIEEISASSMQDMGRVMGATMPKVTGRADGKRVQEMVRKKLQ